jgi:heterogeneous nuclear ribonucleoprotein F/H
MRPSQALAKNGEYIGQRYVRLLHVPRQEMEEQVRHGTLAVPGAAAKFRSRMMRQPRNPAYMPGQLMMPPMPPLPGGRPVVALGAVPYGQPGPVDGRIW